MDILEYFPDDRAYNASDNGMRGLCKSLVKNPQLFVNVTILSYLASNVRFAETPAFLFVI
jgi:hypothetical protein